MSACFSTAYLPPVSYFRQLLKFDTIYIEKHESWQKQSYRNRCYIYGPHGRQMLNIPIVHKAGKELISTINISYNEPWQNTHWQAIQTAYGSSPFFEILAPELQGFYKKQPALLFDWNKALLQLMVDWLQVKINIHETDLWESDCKNDFREAFHPKRPTSGILQKYPQVFSRESGFIQDLSILDLIFNEGPAAYDLLVDGGIG